MKLTINLFTKGLMTDLHPLMTDNTQLTDALNATMITYNGNEFMLQNDMGNTLILDSATGNIMGISPGFIPIGLKEHGGIMYITSVNKNGEGEIGTIPSPIIRDIYKDKVSLYPNQQIPIGEADPLVISNKLYPADKFITNLQMLVTEEDIVKDHIIYKKSDLTLQHKDPSDMILCRYVIKNEKHIPIYTPLISYVYDEKNTVNTEKGELNLFSTKGVYSLGLYSTNNLGGKPETSLMTPQYYEGGNQSKYWFLHTDNPSDMFPKDLLTATLNKDLKLFPSHNKPGKLAVKLAPEIIGQFGMIQRETDPYNVPFTFKYYNDESKPVYATFFSGFYYSTDSGIYIDRLAAKVIDEESNTQVNLIYPYNKKLLDFNNISNGASTTYPTNSLFEVTGSNNQTKLWQASGSSIFPQTQSLSDDNTFILSTIPNINNHNGKYYKSSTLGVDESTHTGVFAAELGDKYNNWYRLELDYFDQYDEKHGTFTLRFNPYINDVFGTNLSISNEVEKGESLVMGIELENNRIYTVNWKSYGYPIEYECDGPQVGCTDGEYTSWSKKYRTDGTTEVQFTSSKISQSLLLKNVLSCSLTYNYEYNYIYTIDNPGTLYIDGDSNIPSSFSSNKGKLSIRKPDDSGFIGFVLGGDKNINDQIVSISYGTLVDCSAYSHLVFHSTMMESFALGDKSNIFDSSLVDGLDQRWKLCSAFDTDKDITTEKDVTLPNLTGLYMFPNTINYADTTITVSHELNDITGKPGILYKKGSWDKVVDGGNGYGNKDVCVTWGYASALKDGLKEGMFNFIVKSTVNFDQTVKYKSKDILTPSYKITPCFTLTGKNDYNKPIYIRRFGKTEDLKSDIYYECNFETDSEGNVLDYWQIKSTISDECAKPCSYNTDEESYFWYKQVSKEFNNYLDAGVYVLNMQKCPGTSSWIISEGTILVDLNIEVNGNKYKYSEGTIDYWLTSNSGNSIILFKDGISKLGKATEAAERIYIPIIIVVKQSQKILIKIDNCDKSYLNYQSIGLFKLKDVTKSDIETDFADVGDVLLCHDYMKYVVQKAEPFKSDNYSIWYNFILKYGVFFKEAYVFIDGLVDSSGIVQPVEIGENTYLPDPYIPKDPSILPVCFNYDYFFGTNRNSPYIWNAYALPESVLTSPDTGYFVFSNSYGTTYPVKAERGNLRSHVK